MIGVRTSLIARALAALAIGWMAQPTCAADMLDLAVADVVARPGDAVELVAKLEKKVPRGANVPRANPVRSIDCAKIA